MTHSAVVRMSLTLESGEWLDVWAIGETHCHLRHPLKAKLKEQKATLTIEVDGACNSMTVVLGEQRSGFTRLIYRKESK